MKILTRFLLVFLATFCGCATVPEPRYYRVSIDVSAVCDASLHSYRESLRVARFHAIAPLRQDSLVTYQESSAIVDFSPHACWESSPPDIVSRELAEAFRASRLFSRVDSYPRRPPADYLLRGKVLRFNQLETERGLYGEVGLQVEFTHRENGTVLWSAVIRVQEQTQEDGAEAAIQAVGNALQHCIRQILQHVKRVTAYHGSFT